MNKILSYAAILTLLTATAIAGEKSVSRCIYTPDVLARPRLRGVMSGGGNMREDDFKTLHEWGATLLRFQMVRDWHGARIYVGEFSAVCWAPGAENYLRDAISIFKEYGWDWTYHAFREWAGWSVEHEGEDDASLRPSADNPRKQALLEGFRQ